MNYNKINPRAIGNPSMVNKVMGMVNNSYGAMNNLATQSFQDSYGQDPNSMGQQIAGYNPLDNAVVNTDMNLLGNSSPVDVNSQIVKFASPKPPNNVKTRTTPPYNLNNK
tara:strand:+ start:232 stop:561 length:330 start_codon:yes stop_codon:yes gene_type:complete